MSRIEGYPTSIGSKKLGTVVKAGPLVYAAGGFEVEAVEFGLSRLGGIDFAGGMDSQNGVYFVAARINAGQLDTTPRQSVFIQVFLASSGAEVANATNLGAVTFRLWAVGS